ncbi:MAG: MFS transporter [Vampirovibrionales bacterium]
MQGAFWQGVTRVHWLVFLGCWLGGIFDGMDSSLYMVIQHDALADLLHTTSRTEVSQVGSWVMSAFLFGWMAGGILFGAIGDRYGRVTAMVWSITLYALFTGLSGLVQEPWQLAVCRFLTGFGIGGELVSISTMLSETWPERSRAVAVGMLITSYQVGVFLAGLVPTVIYDAQAWLATLGWTLAPWRLVFYVGVLPAILAIVLRLRMKEPEVWQQQQSHSAHWEQFSLSSVLGQVRAIFAPHYRRDVWVGGTIFGSLLVAYWASLAWIPTWIQDLLGSAGTGTEKSVATMIHGLCAVVGCALSGLVANRIGRAKTVLVGYSGMLASMALLLLTNPTFNNNIYWQDGLLGFFNGLGQAVMYVLARIISHQSAGQCGGVLLKHGAFCNCLGGVGCWGFGGAVGWVCSGAYGVFHVVPIGHCRQFCGPRNQGRALAYLRQAVYPHINRM